MFCKAFKAGRGMSFCGSSEKLPICKLRKTTVITSPFPSYLNVTTSMRASSCLSKSLNFSEWSVYVLQEGRVKIPAFSRHTHVFGLFFFSSAAFSQLGTRFYKALVLHNVENQRFLRGKML